MSRGLNKVMLIGNVGAEPEIRATSSGSRIAKVSLATNQSWTDRSGQKQEQTEWHRLTFFGRLVDIVEQWVRKGDRLYVEGRLHYSQTEDETGATRYWTEIIVDELVMLGSVEAREENPLPARRSPSRGRGSRYAPAPATSASAAESAPDDDLPF